MPVLIDGHNLIGRVPDIHLEDPDDEARLVSRLQAYAGRTGKRVTVVFDRGMPGGCSENLSGGRVEVVFAPTGRNADRVLIERIRRSPNPQGLIVVTSDREVIAAAEGRGARVVHSEAFASELDATPVSSGAKEEAQLSEEEVEAWLAVFEEGETGGGV
ncbi:MAG: NYN domain-containing protein [Anaerolineae bacterium]